MLKSVVQQAFSGRNDDTFEIHFLTQSQSWTWINDLPTRSSPNRHLRIRLRMLQYLWRKFSYTLNNNLEICHCIWLGPFEYFLDMCATDIKQIHVSEYMFAFNTDAEIVFSRFLHRKGCSNIIFWKIISPAQWIQVSVPGTIFTFCWTVHTFVSYIYEQSTIAFSTASLTSVYGCL